MTTFGIIILGLLLLRGAALLWLEHLNQGHVRRHAGGIPEAFRGVLDEATYEKSVRYTLVKSRFEQFETVYDVVFLGVFMFSGVLPWSYQWFAQAVGTAAWALSLWLLCVGVAMSVAGLPLGWYQQFYLEESFGFNTTTRKLWWQDRAKGLVLSLAIGWPLVLLILKLVEWTGAWWWLWAWGCLMAFQLVMSVLAPILILPLFNKLTPLPEGSLRERLLALGHRTGFSAQNILVMDGSRRSRHSNAFFTSLGRWRKIVLFDTLIQQLAEVELEAVLAHEIGHYKKGHIPKMLAASAVGSLVGFWALNWVAQQGWFYRSFGFAPGNMVAALLIFSLCSGLISFWLSPLANFWSRRYEYQADAYAAGVMNEPQSLIGALRKLNEKNLSNLTPHPIYSGFHYSHPALLEREAALSEFSKASN